MINIECAKEVFKKYVSNYDINNNRILLKYNHSLRVSKLCKDIALSLKLNDEGVLLAELIGLLHDIGRFEQLEKYNSFDDRKTIDHGLLGTILLFNNNMIRDYMGVDTFDEIIKKAIFIHNKASIPQSFNDTEKLYVKIVRDADKIDILYLMSIKEIYYELDNEEISEEVLNCILDEHFINHKIVKTVLDKVLLNLAFIYDLNFNYSYKVINKEKYISMIIDALNLSDLNSIRIFNIVEEFIYKKLEKCEEVD
ncbi:MAG: HD domain-containing protein [Bacilli bacterium]|nr:HD domain-containing protein [Bacilli bacterium]MDD4053951.1 HD domain-containing protein [Bacilli bacterium]MDD4411211.1 HD domain-containing protein [Bacilli bacterium]